MHYASRKHHHFIGELDAFLAAATIDIGVKLIPFPAIYFTAANIADDVQRKKEIVQAYNYVDIETKKDKFLTENKKNEEIESSRKEIVEFKNSMRRAVRHPLKTK